MRKKSTTPLIKADEKGDVSESITGSHMSIRTEIRFQHFDTVFTYMTGFERVEISVRAAA